MEFNVTVSKEDAKEAVQLGLPLHYKVKPSHTSTKLEVWYVMDGIDRYALYERSVVERKLLEGNWIKEPE